MGLFCSSIVLNEIFCSYLGSWVACEVKTKGFIKPLALGWVGGEGGGRWVVEREGKGGEREG
jgi:hypothetical protein